MVKRELAEVLLEQVEKLVKEKEKLLKEIEDQQAITEKALKVLEKVNELYNGALDREDYMVNLLKTYCLYDDMIIKYVKSQGYQYPGEKGPATMWLEKNGYASDPKELQKEVKKFVTSAETKYQQTYEDLGAKESADAPNVNHEQTQEGEKEFAFDLSKFGTGKKGMN